MAPTRERARRRRIAIAFCDLKEYLKRNMANLQPTEFLFFVENIQRIFTPRCQIYRMAHAVINEVNAAWRQARLTPKQLALYGLAMLYESIVFSVESVQTAFLRYSDDPDFSRCFTVPNN